MITIFASFFYRCCNKALCFFRFLPLYLAYDIADAVLLNFSFCLVECGVPYVYVCICCFENKINAKRLNKK